MQVDSSGAEPARSPSAGNPPGPADPEHGAAPMRRRPVRRGWYVLLLLPFAATLVPPFYARTEPSVGGWPFFYWWQFAWIVITAIIVGVVYRVTTRSTPMDDARDGDHDRTDSGGE